MQKYPTTDEIIPKSILHYTIFLLMCVKWWNSFLSTLVMVSKLFRTWKQKKKHWLWAYEESGGRSSDEAVLSDSNHMQDFNPNTSTFVRLSTAVVCCHCPHPWHRRINQDDLSRLFSLTYIVKKSLKTPTVTSGFEPFLQVSGIIQKTHVGSRISVYPGALRIIWCSSITSYVAEIRHILSQ